MRKMLVAVAIVGTGLASASAVRAAPKGEPEVWQCPGGTTLITTAGRNGWIEGQKYRAVEFSIVGSFTPTGGTSDPVNEHKVWAGGKDLGSDDAVTCTMHVDDTSPDGHFIADFEVTAVPA